MSSWSNDVQRRLAIRPGSVPETPDAEKSQPAAPVPAPTGSTPAGVPAWRRFTGRPTQRDLPGYDERSNRRGERRPTVLRALVGHDAAADRVAAAADRITTPVVTGRRVVVVGATGGAGTTTVATLLGRVLSTYRPDRTLLAAGEADHGSLATRLGIDAEASEATVHAALGELVFATSCQMSKVLPLDSGLAVLAAHEGDPELLRRAIVRMASACAVTVVDAGRRIDHPSLRDAHAVVVVAPLTFDGIAGARSVVTTLAADHPATGIVVATVDTGIASGVTHDDYRTQLDAPLAPLPHDRHLAGGAAVRLGRLSERGRLAALELAGDVITTATRGSTSRG